MTDGSARVSCVPKSTLGVDCELRDPPDRPLRVPLLGPARPATGVAALLAGSTGCRAGREARVGGLLADAPTLGLAAVAAAGAASEAVGCAALPASRRVTAHAIVRHFSSLLSSQLVTRRRQTLCCQHHSAAGTSVIWMHGC